MAELQYPELAGLLAQALAKHGLNMVFDILRLLLPR